MLKEKMMQKEMKKKAIIASFGISGAIASMVLKRLPIIKNSSFQKKISQELDEFAISAVEDAGMHLLDEIGILPDSITKHDNRINIINVEIEEEKFVSDNGITIIEIEDIESCKPSICRQTLPLLTEGVKK